MIHGPFYLWHILSAWVLGGLHGRKAMIAKAISIAALITLWR